MNKISLVLAAAALLASSNLPAAAELKIGFVNTERIFREAAPAASAQKKLEKEFASRATRSSRSWSSRRATCRRCSRRTA